jgi:hypothetical protein
MDNDNQAPAARGGRPPGAINYQNNVLIAIVERLLPQGLEGWREVALEYQRQTGEAVLRRGEDVRENWVKKLCKNMKKPTGKPGDLLDRHFRCLAIERRIQDRANAAILGVRSAESSHRSDDGSKESYDDDDDVGAVAAAGVGSVGGPPADIHFDNPGIEDDLVNDEVAAASNAGELNAAVARGEDAARDRPQSLPLLNRASSAASAAASQRGGSSRSSAAPRRSPSSFVTESGGEGGQKSKNSTNRDRVSLSKSIQRVADSLETAGGGGESGMMVSMMSMQMQNMQQQFSMQQQMFQQHLQMQMAAIERRAETSERYLRRIAKAVGDRNNKRKRGGSDNDDESDEDDD